MGDVPLGCGVSTDPVRPPVSPSLKRWPSKSPRMFKALLHEVFSTPWIARARARFPGFWESGPEIDRRVVAWAL
jgi:hypothetical protein